jgi:FKBP-type peptidyl-prolyl cis-trans isomerase FkpA
MRSLLAALLLLFAGSAVAQGPQTEEEKTLYAMGQMVARGLKDYHFTAKEAEMLKRGLGDALAGKKPAVDVGAYEQKVRELAENRRTAAAARQKEGSKGFLEAAAKEKGAVRTDSGLVYLSLKEGSGDSPKATDKVKVSYEGKLTDGTVFDASARHGGPAEFPLNGVIPCWTEGVQRMKPGGKARLVCPSAIAYGDKGVPGVIPGGSTLVFEVELLEVKK